VSLVPRRPPPQPPERRCPRCERQLPVAFLDEFGTCEACARAISEQMRASWPRIEHDCDQLGAFHAWCREHDDAAERDDPALD
jgi:hypothetical protein